MKRVVPMIVLAVAVSAALPATAGKPSARSTSQTTTATCTDGSGNVVGTIRYEGPATMWPPNHKYRDATITATDEDGDDTVILVSSGAHDQSTPDGELNGAGDTDDDVVAPPSASTGTGSTSQTVQIRSERSGRDRSGRTYTIVAEATFSDSDEDDSSEDVTSCRAEFTAVVPHDQRKPR